MKLLKTCWDIKGGDYGDIHPQAFMQGLIAKGFTPIKLLRLGEYRSEWVYDHGFDPVSAAPTYEQRIAEEAKRLEQEQAAEQHAEECLAAAE
jgi:hypothetical protein